MNRSATFRISARIPPLLCLAILALAAGLPGSAPAQLATIPPKVTPLELLELRDRGTFDIWQGNSLLGFEKYEAYLSITGDSLITWSAVEYTLVAGQETGRFAKESILIDGTLDAYPLFYQTRELVGSESRAMSMTIVDTTAQIFREKSGAGVGSVIEIPRGRFFIFDPSVYHHIEILLGRFARRSVDSRHYQVLVPATETVLDLRAVRGDEETVQLSDGTERTAVKVELSDDLTKFEAWIDEGGRLLRLEAKAQGIKVIRRPDEKTSDS
jgi:hypothetical protein